MQTRLLAKKSKNGSKGYYSDYYCKRPLYSMYLLGFIFTFFVDSVVFFTSSGTSLQWSHRLLAGYLQCGICNVKSDWCIAWFFCIEYKEVSRLLLCLGAILIASFFF